MTLKERVIAQIKHQETDFIPYFLIFEEDGDKNLVEQGALKRVNSYYGDDSWRTKLDNHIKIIPTVSLGMDMERTFCTDPYGTQWRVDKRPAQIVKPVLDKPTLKGYTFPNADTFFDEGWHERALKLIDKYKNSFLITPFYLGLYDRTWVIRGFENVLMDSILHPDFYRELVEKIFKEHMMFLDRVLTLPLDGILFAQDVAYQEGIIIGAERWREYFKPYIAKMYAKVHQAGKYTFHHMCGSVAEILPDLIDIGLDVYESVQPEPKDNNPYRLKRLYGDDITFWGGLGSQRTIPFGSPPEIKAEVRKLCQEMGKGGGYILEPSKPIQPETPTENAVAVIEALAEQAGINI